MIPKRDLMIVAELRQNARKTLTEISRKTSIPVSTIHDRIQYCQKGLIKKHATLIDFSRLGFNTRANIMLKVSNDSREEAEKFLLKHNSINCVYKAGSGFDFLAEGIFKDIKEMEDFIDMLRRKVQAERIEVCHIIEDLKRESFLNDQKSLGIVPQGGPGK